MVFSWVIGEVNYQRSEYKYTPSVFREHAGLFAMYRSWALHEIRS